MNGKITVMPSVALGGPEYTYDELFECPKKNIRKVRCSICGFTAIGENFWALVKAIADHLQFDENNRLRITPHNGQGLFS